MKRLALFLDGTWNTVSSQTNVSLLCDCVITDGHDVLQEVYYEPGVGTGRFDWLRGGALGYGLSENILTSYEWLRRKYDDGDEIYIFGFSRGAYTARSLAGFIAKCGLLIPNSGFELKDLFERYQLSATTRPIYEIEHAVSQGQSIGPDEKRLLENSRRIPIKMIAVWDTVGALGIPFGDIPGLSRSRFQFHHTRLSNLFEHAYHALAVDEHREAFAPTLWTTFAPHVPDSPRPGPVRMPNVEQRWFAGAHADVGGGNKTRLPELPMHWLAKKARDAGLGMRLSEPDSSAYRDPITDSYGSFMFGLYRLAKLNRRFQRVIQAPSVRKKAGTVSTVNETIDASVFARVQADEAYRPPSLLDWSKRTGVKLDGVRDAVSAKTGRSVA